MIDPRFITSREYMNTIRVQFVRVVNGVRIGRLLTVGDLKSQAKFVGIDKTFSAGEGFMREVIKTINRIFRQGGIPEFYGSVIIFDTTKVKDMEVNYTKHLNGLNEVNDLFPPISHSLVIDIDVKPEVNGWLMREDGLERLAVLDEIARELIGVGFRFVFGNGVQAHADLYPIHLMYYKASPGKWPEIVLNTVREFHQAIAMGLARKFESRTGRRLVIDEKVYDKARVVRLDFSPHAGLRLFSIPLSPDEVRGLTLDEVRRMQSNTNLVRRRVRAYDPFWGVVTDAGKYSELLGMYITSMSINTPLPRVRNVRLRRKTTGQGWLSIEDPRLGRIEYDARISGFNYAFIIVRNRLPITDGRLNAMWAICPALIGGPKTREGPVEDRVTEEDCLEWVKASIERYPSGKGISDYEKQLKASLKHKDRYNIPTFEHLIKEVTADGNPLDDKLKEIKYPLLYALYEYGYIRLTPEQVETLKTLAGL